MKIHLDAVFNTILHNTHEATPFILEYLYLDLESVHLQMEYINKDMQYVTSDYLVKTPTHNTNLLDTADDKINYIKELLQPCQNYHESTTTTVIQVSSPTTQYHLTPDVRS